MKLRLRIDMDSWPPVAAGILAGVDGVETAHARVPYRNQERKSSDQALSSVRTAPVLLRTMAPMFSEATQPVQ